MTQQTFAWFQDARQWDLIPTEELPAIELDDTQILPAVGADGLSQTMEAAEPERAADVAVRWHQQPQEQRLDPSDPAAMNWLLNKLRDL